ncbi:unnamed protein product, partial [marine sediment metagenome]
LIILRIKSWLYSFFNNPLLRQSVLDRLELEKIEYDIHNEENLWNNFKPPLKKIVHSNDNESLDILRNIGLLIENGNLIKFYYKNFKIHSSLLYPVNKNFYSFNNLDLEKQIEKSNNLNKNPSF